MMTNKMPVKIDIGAIYSDSPKYKSSRHPQHALKGGAVLPKEKEICFDIDMTDYDPVRFCCSGAAICSKCWVLMKIAAKILDQALKKFFGLKNLLWVYSGRRGIHCWVCDPTAREYNSSTRSAIAEYCQLLKGASGPGVNGAAEKKRMSLFGNGVELAADAVKIIDEYWEEYVSEQKLMEGSNYLKLTGLIKNDEIRNRINDLLKGLPIEKRFHAFSRAFDKKKPIQRNSLSEIKLQFCYPRLDINVSKDVHHLLKSPFSIHPKTGNVCVPFVDFDAFDPFTDVPTLEKISNEWQTGKKVTSLKPFVDTFEEFVKK